MAFPFFPESHPAMSVENYAYMRRLWQHQEQHQEQHRPQSSSPTGDSDQSNLKSRGRPQSNIRRLARFFIPAKLRRSKSFEGLEGPVADQVPNGRNNNDDLLSRCTSDNGNNTFLTDAFDRTLSSPSTTTSTHNSDPARQIFRLCADLLTNPFSRGFELNPLLLNIAHPLISGRHQTSRLTRVLDLGGNADSVYSNTIATLPGAAVCQFTQTQLESRLSPSSLPFSPNSFNVVSARTLYKYFSNSHCHHQLPERSRGSEPSLEACIREIYRVLDKDGSFEYIFFDRQLGDAGPLTRELERFLYEDGHRCCTVISTQGQSSQQSGSVGREACIYCLNSASGSATPNQPVTGTQFLEILANEGFTTEKNTTLMFPLSLLTTVFTQDGQRLRSSHGDSPEIEKPGITPMLASLMRTVHGECREFQTAWKCIIGSARKL